MTKRTSQPSRLAIRKTLESQGFTKLLGAEVVSVEPGVGGDGGRPPARGAAAGRARFMAA